MIDKRDSFIEILLKIELISIDQYKSALSHADVKQLDEVESESDALFWMLQHGFVTEKELNAKEDTLDSLPEIDPGRNEKLEIVGEVLNKLAHIVSEVIRVPLDTLLRLGLINAEQYEAGCDIRPSVAEGIVDSPAHALAVLVNRGIVTEVQFEQLKNQTSAMQSFAEDKARSEIVAEAGHMFHDIVGTYVKAMSVASLRLFVILVTLILSVVGIGLWYSSTPANPPSCTDQSVVSLVNNLFVKADVEKRSYEPYFMGGSDTVKNSVFKFDSAQEIGYLLPERIRGCLATVSRGNDRSQFAYIVSFSEKNKVTIKGINPNVLKNSFGYLDEK